MKAWWLGGLVGFLFGGIIGGATFGFLGSLIGSIFGGGVGSVLLFVLSRAARRLDEKEPPSE
jgi:hypothetical protein